MYKLNNTITTITILSIFSCGISIAADKPAKANCALRQVDESCALEWNYTENPREHYIVQKLDKEKLVWVDIARSSGKDNKGTNIVELSGLYRVIACDNLGARSDCHSSSAVWVTSLDEMVDMPLDMIIRDYDGSDMKVSLSDEADRYTQTAQYNVFLLTDLVNRVGIANPDILPPMYAPDEPQSDHHPNLDHQVQHNIYSVYEELRNFHQKNF